MTNVLCVVLLSISVFLWGRERLDQIRDGRIHIFSDLIMIVNVMHIGFAVRYFVWKSELDLCGEAELRFAALQVAMAIFMRLFRRFAYKSKDDRDE